MDYPNEAGVLPLVGFGPFPGLVGALNVWGSSKAVIDSAAGFVVVALGRNAPVEVATASELFEIGTLCRIVNVKREGEEYLIVVAGIARCRLGCCPRSRRFGRE